MAQDDQDTSHRSIELQLSGRIKQVEQLLQGQMTGHHDLAALKTLTDKVGTGRAGAIADTRGPSSHTCESPRAPVTACADHPSLCMQVSALEQQLVDGLQENFQVRFSQGWGITMAEAVAAQWTALQGSMMSALASSPSAHQHGQPTPEGLSGPLYAPH